MWFSKLLDDETQIAIWNTIEWPTWFFWSVFVLLELAYTLLSNAKRCFVWCIAKDDTNQYFELFQSSRYEKRSVNRETVGYWVTKTTDRRFRSCTSWIPKLMAAMRKKNKSIPWWRRFCTMVLLLSANEIHNYAYAWRNRHEPRTRF